jgi:hypothetical protein
MLITDQGAVPDIPLPGPPVHRLVGRVVDAARAWAAFALGAADVIPDDEEGVLRLALLDSVHDLEHAETNSGRIPRAGERPLFGDPA